MATPAPVKQEFIDFARWKGMSDSQRERHGWPVKDNISAMARQLGVSRPTLYRWMKMPEFKAMVQAIADDEFALDVPRAKSTLRELATREDFSNKHHLEMMLKMAGEYNDERTVKTEVNGHITHSARVMDEEELERAHLEELKALPEFEDKSDDEIKAIAGAMTRVQAQQRPAAALETDEEAGSDGEWREEMDWIPDPELTLEPSDE